MADYISREAAIKAFENADADVLEDYGDGACDWGFGMKNIQTVLNSVPAADVEPVRHGRWVNTEPDIPAWRHNCSAYYKCSCCGRRTGRKRIEVYKFFPQCGAKMDLEDEK